MTFTHILQLIQGFYQVFDQTSVLRSTVHSNKYLYVILAG